VADAGLLVDPFDPGQIAEAMRQILTNPDLHADLSARGRAQAQRFSWKRAAHETLTAYQLAGAGS
jgi:glycosyltransferase involved in cell wall biosynthesis